jgi:exonuclease III
MANLSQHYKILSWNIRGINSTTRQEDLRQIINSSKPDIICIQETKMASINSPVIGNALGNDYEANYCFLPAEGTRGGILLSTKNLVVKIQSHSITNHTISAQMFDERHNFSWTFTGVYGPQGE